MHGFTWKFKRKMGRGNKPEQSRYRPCPGDKSKISTLKSKITNSLPSSDTTDIHLGSFGVSAIVCDEAARIEIHEPRISCTVYTICVGSGRPVIVVYFYARKGDGVDCRAIAAILNNANQLLLGWQPPFAIVTQQPEIMTVGRGLTPSMSPGVKLVAVVSIAPPVEM